jgi:branched-chain amino acid transport system substrate-binding protein
VTAAALPARGRLLRAAAAASIGCGAAWPKQPLFAQARAKRPLLIGLATDDTGPYGASGQDEQRGMLMAIAEANANAGVLGRQSRPRMPTPAATPSRPPVLPRK